MKKFLLPLLVLSLLNSFDATAKQPPQECPVAPTADQLSASPNPVLIECPGQSRHEPWGRIFIFAFIPERTPEDVAASYFHYENMSRFVPRIKSGSPQILQNPCPTLHLVRADISTPIGSDEIQRMWNHLTEPEDQKYSSAFQLSQKSAHFFNLWGNIEFTPAQSTRAAVNGTYLKQMLIFNPDIGVGENIAHKQAKSASVDAIKRFKSLVDTAETRATWIATMRTALAASGNGSACHIPEKTRTRQR